MTTSTITTKPNRYLLISPKLLTTLCPDLEKGTSGRLSRVRFAVGRQLCTPHLDIYTRANKNLQPHRTLLTHGVSLFKSL
jgi:hypothetical protein